MSVQSPRAPTSQAVQDCQSHAAGSARHAVGWHTSRSMQALAALDDRRSSEIERCHGRSRASLRLKWSRPITTRGLAASRREASWR